jgi:alpha-beta hydrolase superfamily lysophospholipase
VLLHGYGDHSWRYDEFARYLTARGITVHSFDQRWHGRSDGKRGRITRFDTLQDDLDLYLKHIQGDLRHTPPFFMGHSMGGLLLARYAETRKPATRGLIFSSPFLKFSPDIPKWLIAISGLLGKYTPWLPVSRSENMKLSRDPKIKEIADNDECGLRGFVYARTGLEFALAHKAAEEAYGEIAAPALVMYGTDDSVVDPAGGQAIHDGCASKDRTLRVFEGGYHELFNDLEKEVFFQTAADWMLAR